jgi:hypothetical protein
MTDARNPSETQELTSSSPSNTLATLAQLASVLSVVAGVVISVWSFSAARDKETETRRFEASKPFLDLRQKLYTEIVQTADVLTNPETETPEALAAAKKRFRELYVTELSMVEDDKVEQAMANLAAQIDPELKTKWAGPRDAAYKLSHALRASFLETYGVEQQGKK